MPVYLVHGFRWPRAGFTGIRVHAILHKLEETSVEYIQNANSCAEILASFRTAWPDVMKAFEGPGRTLTFVEQYDPEDETSDAAVSQPFAFVADRVITLAGGAKGMPAPGSERPGSPPSKNKSTAEHTLPLVAATQLSLNVEEVIAEGPGFTPAAWEALAELRDKLAEKEKIGWWVVYNGDPERAYDDEGDSDEEEEDDDDDEYAASTPETEVGAGKPLPAPVLQSSLPPPPATSRSHPTPVPANLRKDEPPLPPPPSSASLGSTMPIRDTGKRLPEAPVEKEKSTAPLPQSPPTPKSKGGFKTEGFKKKFFGRKP